MQRIQPQIDPDGDEDGAKMMMAAMVSMRAPTKMRKIVSTIR
jgi:hypothetical protein